MGLRGAVAASLALLLAGPSAGALAGQETVRSAVVRADLTDTAAGARVRVEYTVAGAEPGRAIPATLLVFGSAHPEDLRVGSGGRPLAFEAGAGRSRTVGLPTEPDGSGNARVLAEYTIPLPVSQDGDALRGHVPILSLDRPPGEARPGLFRGEVTLPAHWTVSEAFPTGLRATGAPAGSARTLSVELPVVPASLSFRAHTGGGWHPGLPFVLDVLAALFIIGFSYVGWRHIREEAS